MTSQAGKEATQADTSLADKGAQADASLLDKVAQFRAGDPSALLDSIPYTRFMGLSVEHGDEGLIGHMDFGEHLVGNPALPALHGGTVAALLESTAVFQVLWQADSLILPKTINITVQYLRSGKPVPTHAQARITKQGRRVVVVHTEAWQTDRQRPIATASAQFLVEPPDESRTIADKQSESQDST